MSSAWKVWQRLVEAGVPVIVGTGAQNRNAPPPMPPMPEGGGRGPDGHSARALARTRSAAQKAHFKAVLSAAPKLPAVIYNSPYYGFETRADLFFALRAEHTNLVGFKEFGGAAVAPLCCRAHHRPRSRREPDGRRRYRGVPRLSSNCGATGAITGIGNVLPREVLHLVACAARRPRAMSRRAGAWPWNSKRRWACSPPSTKVPTSCSTTST